MVRVEASWQDESGTSRSVFATLEDRSTHGLGIHIAERLPTGLRLEIKSPTGQFIGVVMHCQRLNKGFFLGIERAPAAQ